MQRPSSPVPSCVSLKSNNSKGLVSPDLSSDPSTADPHRDSKKQRPSSPVPSCVSLKSNNSKGLVSPDLSSDPPPDDPHRDSKKRRPSSPVPSCVSLKSNNSKGLVSPDLSSDPPHANPHELRADLIPGQSRHVVEASVNTGEHTDNKQTDYEDLRRVIENHKVSLRRRFENISEGIIKPAAETLLSNIYTEHYITKGGSEGVNKEHEIWQIESASRSQTTEDTSVNCNDIFKAVSGQEKDIRIVMTKGVAGIGKTVSVQNFIIDWTDGVANQDVDFMFPLSFRGLNLVKGDQYSLHRLLLDFHPELKELNDVEVYKDCRVVFILDGLDESRISLNFQVKNLVSDVKHTSTVDTLLTSLIKGTLFPSALIWITSRPAAASQIPHQYIDQFIEMRGFNDLQKEEYFRKRISDESQANSIISHIRASRSLHIMCHIPVFCWIVATVLQQMMEKKNIKDIPKTLTEMFIQFLLIQTTRNDQKYPTETAANHANLLEPQRKMLLKLAELAFKNLENGNLIFYEDDLRECGIDVNEASVYSGMCTEIFKEESVFHQKNVYCFVHLTVQEFLAALHIFSSYTYQMKTMGSFFCLEESLKFAVTKVLESKNGHLDLFLRFLMGMSLQDNQILLQGLLNHMPINSQNISEISRYMKKLNRDNLSPERCINLFHCLLEMGDRSIHEWIQGYLMSPHNSKQKLSPAQCSALAQTLLMSEQVLDEFDLKKYNTSDEGRRRLIPAVRCCRKARLHGCELNQMSCETVMRCLQSANSLIELDLSCNALGDSGVQLLSAGLTSPHCKLQTLRLTGCNLSGESCKMVACVLQSANPLKELDLSDNDLGDSGVQHLSEGLASPDSKLQILRLSGCLISEEGCRYLTSALNSDVSHLQELDLSYNHPGESGRKLLSDIRDYPLSNLEILNTDHCAEIRFRRGVRKYAYDLTLDPSTSEIPLSLSEGNRKVTNLGEKQSLHLQSFAKQYPALCREGLSERCYWEAEWGGDGGCIAVTYKIMRKGESDACGLGRDDKSWSLLCSPDCYSVWHNNQHTAIPAPSSDSSRVGVYLDWLDGTLSFYSVSSDTLTPLHTFHSTFTEPLYPGFWVQPDSSISLCQIT